MVYVVVGLFSAVQNILFRRENENNKILEKKLSSLVKYLIGKGL